MRSKRFLVVAGIVTLFGIGGIGIVLIVLFQHQPVEEIFLAGTHSPFIQLLTGFAYGIISSVVLLILLNRKMLDAARYFFAGVLKKYGAGYTGIILLSFCAGVGEELLFRGALQYWAGVWLTSFVFIFLHGYLNPTDRPLFMYGTVLLIVSSGFGYLMKYSGLFAAMNAHFLVDVVLMIYLKRFYKDPADNEQILP